MAWLPSRYSRVMLNRNFIEFKVNNLEDILKLIN